MSSFLKLIKTGFSKGYYALGIYLLPAVAFADGDTPVGQGLGYFITAMTGKTGIAISVIAVMVCGLLALVHFIKWMHVLYVIGGIGVIFGATAIVEGITNLIR